MNNDITKRFLLNYKHSELSLVVFRMVCKQWRDILKEKYIHTTLRNRNVFKALEANYFNLATFFFTFYVYTGNHRHITNLGLEHIIIEKDLPDLYWQYKYIRLENIIRESNVDSKIWNASRIAFYTHAKLCFKESQILPEKFEWFIYNHIFTKNDIWRWIFEDNNDDDIRYISSIVIKLFNKIEIETILSHKSLQNKLTPDSICYLLTNDIIVLDDYNGDLFMKVLPLCSINPKVDAICDNYYKNKKQKL